MSSPGIDDTITKYCSECTDLDLLCLGSVHWQPPLAPDLDALLLSDMNDRESSRYGDLFGLKSLQVALIERLMMHGLDYDEDKQSICVTAGANQAFAMSVFRCWIAGILSFYSRLTMSRTNVHWSL